MLIANKTTAKRLYKFRPMYEINSISVLVVKEMLENETILKKYIKETNLGKKYLIAVLDKLGFSYFDSYTNFLLVDFKTNKLKNKIWSYLKSKKILITGEPNIPGCENFLRFTLGPLKYMKLITKSLNKFS